MYDKRELFQTLFKRFGLMNRNCCEADGMEISMSQSQILYEIGKREAPSMQEIAETLGTDISTFSRQVQTLIKMELVKKTPSSADRRIYVLSLTGTGISAAQAIEEEMEAHLEEIFSHMNAFEQETVMRSLQLLNEAMAKSEACCKPIF